jgi:hypothetical protein
MDAGPEIIATACRIYVSADCAALLQGKTKRGCCVSTVTGLCKERTAGARNSAPTEGRGEWRSRMQGRQLLYKLGSNKRRVPGHANEFTETEPTRQAVTETGWARVHQPSPQDSVSQKHPPATSRYFGRGAPPSRLGMIRRETFLAALHGPGWEASRLRLALNFIPTQEACNKQQAGLLLPD